MSDGPYKIVALVLALAATQPEPRYTMSEVIENAVWHECPPYQVNGRTTPEGVTTYRIAGPNPGSDRRIWTAIEEARTECEYLNAAYAAGRAAREEEVERLRKALERIVDRKTMSAEALRCIARAALAEEGK